MLIKEFDKGSAHIMVFENRVQMGTAAGKAVAEKIRELQKQKKEMNIMFAAAPSQNEVLEQLVSEEGICWKAVNAFHMDEYIGLPAEHPAGFANFLKRALFTRLPFKEVFYINGSSSDTEAEVKRYAGLLKEHPLDICVLGIGENGHLAFNDPGVADFHDSLLVKAVELDEQCRQQQVNDGCFTSLNLVPAKAITVTIPGLMAADHLYCSVPSATKAKAVRNLVTGDISLSCPASILTRKHGVKIYLDADSAKDIL